MKMPSRMILILLCFFSLCIAPILICNAQDIALQRGVYNEVNAFIDRVRDTGKLTDSELSDFYLALNSKGANVNAKVYRRIKVVNPDGEGGTYTTYTYSDKILTSAKDLNDPNLITSGKWNQGDFIIVDFKEINSSPSKRLLTALHLGSPTTIDDHLSGMVRN